MNIENTREIFFNNSKEQYLYFKKCWSQAVNSVQAKPQVVTEQQRRWSTLHEVRVRKDGWLGATHHLVYALLCGKDVYKSFRPITNKNRLSNGAYLNHGLHFARNKLTCLAIGAKRLLDPDNNFRRDFAQRMLDEFLEPFDGSVTLEMLIKLDEICPEFKPMESHFGKWSTIAREIVKGQRNVESFYDLERIMEMEGAA